MIGVGLRDTITKYTGPARRIINFAVNILTMFPKSVTWKTA